MICNAFVYIYNYIYIPKQLLAFRASFILALQHSNGGSRRKKNPEGEDIIDREILGYDMLR